MTEPILDAPRVVAGVGQGIAAGVAEHVSVDRRHTGAPEVVLEVKGKMQQIP